MSISGLRSPKVASPPPRVKTSSKRKRLRPDWAASLYLGGTYFPLTTLSAQKVLLDSAAEDKRWLNKPTPSIESMVPDESNNCARARSFHGGDSPPWLCTPWFTSEATIYGPAPAVCFSEQPLAMFAQYLAARADLAAMAGYGLLIHKHDLYVAGGLPVIYGLGLAREPGPGDDGYDPSRRLLDPTRISLYEQYRYVAFAPNRKPNPLDWSHEREWRWPSDSGTLR